eukprot:CAMPEP_0174826844 /NCGR_PEP_ID=MMETSP1114-20130205/268_1 /TAXON_ID=312471 /ORGANISM="Neobodo designis, Strain CCAP 1951/1" /LENGTH=275 /DNA_ID=CAMNT_0016060413 /DNA_START=68 /DNA_END=895 /DNA_ORIENTATION=-
MSACRSMPDATSPANTPEVAIDDVGRARAALADKDHNVPASPKPHPPHVAPAAEYCHYYYDEAPMPTCLFVPVWPSYIRCEPAAAPIESPPGSPCASDVPGWSTAVANAAPQPKHVTVARVEFSAHRAEAFCLPYALVEACPPGTLVVVDAEHDGVDVGVVTRVLGGTRGFRSSAALPPFTVLYPAPAGYLQLLARREAMAAAALARVRQVFDGAAQTDRMLRGAVVLDCRFQFDGRRLFVFYTAPRKIVYRELLQKLFANFRCRIVMTQLRYRR